MFPYFFPHNTKSAKDFGLTFGLLFNPAFKSTIACTTVAIINNSDYDNISSLLYFLLDNAKISIFTKVDNSMWYLLLYWVTLSIQKYIIMSRRLSKWLVNHVLKQHIYQKFINLIWHHLDSMQWYVTLFTVMTTLMSLCSMLCGEVREIWRWLIIQKSV